MQIILNIFCCYTYSSSLNLGQYGDGAHAKTAREGVNLMQRQKM